jgi:hypothetical protein
LLDECQFVVFDCSVFLVTYQSTLSLSLSEHRYWYGLWQWQNMARKRKDLKLKLGGIEYTSIFWLLIRAVHIHVLEQDFLPPNVKTKTKTKE